MHGVRYVRPYVLRTYIRTASWTCNCSPRLYRAVMAWLAKGLDRGSGPTTVLVPHCQKKSTRTVPRQSAFLAVVAEGRRWVRLPHPCISRPDAVIQT